MRTQRTVKTGKFNLSRLGQFDPRGYQVMLDLPNGRTLLGDVTGAFLEGNTWFLLVVHFNGEPWPVCVPASEVTVLERIYDA